MTTNRSLHFASQFSISCGTVAVDVSQLQTLPILVIRCRRTGEVMLPKGHKNIDEGLEQAAERETYEETGYRVKILPCRFTTLATPAVENAGDMTERSVNDSDSLLSEPFAVQQREVDDGLKIICWFVASGESRSVADQDTQQEGENFESYWIAAADINQLSWNDDRQIASEAIRIVQNLTEDCANPSQP